MGKDPQVDAEQGMARDCSSAASAATATSALDADDDGFFVSPPGAEYEDLEAQYHALGSPCRDSEALVSPVCRFSLEGASDDSPACVQRSAPAGVPVIPFRDLPGCATFVDPLSKIQVVQDTFFSDPLSPGGRGIVDPLTAGKSRVTARPTPTSPDLALAGAPSGSSAVLQELFKADLDMDRATKSARHSSQATAVPRQSSPRWERSVSLSDSDADPESRWSGQKVEPSSRRRGRQAEAAPSGNQMEGWLWKRSRFLRRWRRRWAVLAQGSLATFKSPASRRPTEVFPAMYFSKVARPGNARQSRAFCILIDGRELFFVCDSDAERDLWMQAVHQSLLAQAC
ncbi:unnamed protein product [Polarella glacialis]|uniref:PH domain-containing protein n=1 Tax=Polarella glacialis TaxID=89957 RepID=A0A813KYD1_POLGL|nr:unnamed protein product [Polarella glacialis]